jgi:hypothetical protein
VISAQIQIFCNENLGSSMACEVRSKGFIVLISQKLLCNVAPEYVPGIPVNDQLDEIAFGLFGHRRICNERRTYLAYCGHYSIGILPAWRDSISQINVNFAISCSSSDGPTARGSSRMPSEHEVFESLRRWNDFDIFISGHIRS